jgi:hypothetical protein
MPDVTLGGAFLVGRAEFFARSSAQRLIRVIRNRRVTRAS